MVEGGYASDILLRQSAALDSRDAGLAGEIVFGCLRYQAQLDHLSAIKPYPSAQIDSLNTEMYRKNKTFDARNKQMEQAEERTKKIIQDHAGTHVFSAIDEGLVTSTIE